MLEALEKQISAIRHNCGREPNRSGHTDHWRRNRQARQLGVTLTTSTAKPDEPTQTTCASRRLSWFILEAPFSRSRIVAVLAPRHKVGEASEQPS